MNQKAIALPLGFCFALSLFAASGFWGGGLGPTPAPLAPERVAPAKAFEAPALDPGAAASRADVLARPPPPAPRDGGLTAAPSETTTVRRGDSLWRIARRSFGKGGRYTEIRSANSAQIRDPRKIRPGQVFVMPKDRD